jgi:hypothetical protein
MDRKPLWLTLHMGWALAWGVLISIAPLQLVAVASLLWVPLFVLGEWFWSRKHGVKPALLSGLGLVSAVIFGAAMMPKSMDRPMIPGLTTPTVELGELAKQGFLFSVPAGVEKVPVRFQTTAPTLRQAIRAIEAQTPLRCRVLRCGTGASVLAGDYPMQVILEPPAALTPPSAAAPGGGP